MDQAKELRDLVAAAENPPLPRARVLAVTSGKGGVGKTNMSVALASAVAREGRDVVLVDGDLGLANVDVVFDIQPEYNLSHVISGEVTVEEALVLAPGGVKVLPGAAGMTRMADLSSPEHRLFLRSLDLLEQRTELIIVDTGAGISRRVIDFCLASGEVLIVTTPEPTAIADAYAMIKVLAQADPSLTLWLLINMASSRAEAEQILDRIVVLSERFLGMSVRRAGFVLADPRVPHSVRRRVPFLLAYPSSQATLCVEQVVKTLGLADRGRQMGEGFFRRVTNLLGGHRWMQTAEDES